MLQHGTVPHITMKHSRVPYRAVRAPLRCVAGACPRQDLLLKGGMRAGDALVLTKPLGTGVLFAANMRHRARGRWVSRALASMLTSNAAAASILRVHRASACTDVTGFGLLGHLVEMVQAASDRARAADPRRLTDGTPGGATLQRQQGGNAAVQGQQEGVTIQGQGHGDVTVDLFLDRVPVLDGAEWCIREGLMSSLFPANVRLRREVGNYAMYSDSVRAKIVFDPQTAGGLLASVPEAQAESCVRALRAAGYGDAAVIGQVHAGPREGMVCFVEP